MHRALPSDRGFLAVAALLFAASTATTIAWCGSMSAMPGMQMPGGWTMSMAWMRMPGQTWSGAAATFIGMWAVMMVAMMLPSLVSMLSRYRAAMRRVGDTRLAGPTALAAAAYFAVWTSCGAAAFPLGLGLAEIAMREPAVSRAMPFATSLVVMIAGALQFTAWKQRQLVCCRATPQCALTANADTAFRYGAQLGLRCIRCCAGLTPALLVIGVMDLRAMAVITLAINTERLAPAGARVARVTGAFVVAAGMWMAAHGTA
jgi:predicted metal-binding membrane protein